MYGDGTCCDDQWSISFGRYGIELHVPVGGEYDLEFVWFQRHKWRHIGDVHAGSDGVCYDVLPPQGDEFDSCGVLQCPDFYFEFIAYDYGDGITSIGCIGRTEHVDCGWSIDVPMV
jgi:hypothetical protein